MYYNVKREMTAIQETLKNKETLLKEIGRPVAASLASFIAIVLMAITLGRVLLRTLLGG